jgi:hypothetical protein
MIIESARPGAGLGPTREAPAAAGLAIGGLGAFSEAAYRQADQIRRSIVVPPANVRPGASAHGSANARPGANGGVGGSTHSAEGGAALAGALAGFVASPAGHAALARLANVGSDLLEKAFGLARGAEQLVLPLA